MPVKWVKLYVIGQLVTYVGKEGHKGRLESP